MAGDRGPGPVYDAAFRWMATQDLTALVGWLGEPAGGSPARLSESLPGSTQTADLLVRLHDGRLLHVEFNRTGSWELFTRMIEYRGRIMRAHRDRSLTQHVVVIGAGAVPERVRDGTDFDMSVTVTRMDEQDPAVFLGSASLAPFAVLAGRGGAPRRVDLLKAALEVIRERSTGHHRDEPAAAAATYAAVHLDLPIILAAGRETGMPISLEGTQVARAIAEAAQARGLEQGLEQGLAQGLEQGLERRREERLTLLEALLRERYGDDERIPGVAARAVDPDLVTVLTAAKAAATLDDLIAALPG